MILQVVIDKVLSKAQETASHSWEYGTVFEALLEYRDPHYSIFHDPFPGGGIPELTIEDVEALRYVKPFIQTNSARLCEGNGKLSPLTFRPTHAKGSNQVRRPIRHLSAFRPCCSTNRQPSSRLTILTSPLPIASCTTCSPPRPDTAMARYRIAMRILLCGQTSSTWCRLLLPTTVSSPQI